MTFLLTLRKQKLPCEKKPDLKKSNGEADLKKLARIPFVLELIVRNPDLKNNFLTFRMGWSDLKKPSQVLQVSQPLVEELLGATRTRKAD